MTSLHGFHKIYKHISERHESQIHSHTSNENLAIAIYGLHTKMTSSTPLTGSLKKIT